MKILVDADACPVKEVLIHLAKQRRLEVILMVSVDNYFQRQDDVQVVMVDALPQAVDMALINRVEPGDLVVTHDYGLAALVLSKKGRAISPMGYIYNETTMAALLERRYLQSAARRAGIRTKGPKKRHPEDDRRFRRNLLKLLDELMDAERLKLFPDDPD